MHYRGWILSSYVYNTHMEREWVGGWFSDFQVQLKTLNYIGRNRDTRLMSKNIYPIVENLAKVKNIIRSELKEIEK